MAQDGIRAEDIYAALFDDDAFARLPALLAESGNGRSALMQWRHHDGAYEVLASSYFSSDQMARYPAYAAADPWLHAGFRPDRQNKITLMDRYVPPAAYERSLVYNELARDLGDDTFYCMGVALNSPWGTGVLGVHRGRSGVAFDATDAARWQQSLDHFKNVLRVRGDLASACRARDLARGALDSVALAVITVRADGRILQANAQAETVLGRADGLVCKEGCLTATTREAAVRLADAVGRATSRNDPAATSVAVERGQDRPNYPVTIAPLSGSLPSAAVVLLRDPAAEDASLVSRLRSLFGLTLVEAQIAVDLGKGRSAPDIGQRRGVQPNTLKSQLKSLAAKMNCSRQSEIAAIIAALPPIRPFG